MGRNAPTVKQTKFAANMLLGMPKTKAYALAHPDDKSKPRTLRVQAVKAAKTPNVQAELARLANTPIILDECPQAGDARAIRGHVLARMLRLSQASEPSVQLFALQWLYDYAGTLESKTDSTSDREQLLSDLKGLYKKALQQTPIVETVAEPAAEPADPPAEPPEV
jgi:hypothetical protein